jgi:hypothetical protein
MSRAWLFQPGVPAAGHIVARGGYWHPGPIAGCVKCPPAPGQPDRHGNRVAVEGCTRCPCGSKYWENDACVDCGNGPPAS